MATRVRHGRSCSRRASSVEAASGRPSRSAWPARASRSDPSPRSRYRSQRGLATGPHRRQGRTAARAAPPPGPHRRRTCVQRSNGRSESVSPGGRPVSSVDPVASDNTGQQQAPKGLPEASSGPVREPWWTSARRPWSIRSVAATCCGDMAHGPIQAPMPLPSLAPDLVATRVDPGSGVSSVGYGSSRVRG